MLLGLASFTGGVLLTPFVYLIFEFLRQQHRYHLLGLDTANPPLRASLIIWCSLFFVIGIGTQMVLSPEIERLLLIVVFLPNVVMAWKFGWQGGVLSGLLGSMMITLARQVGVGFGNLVELEIFLATQALLGIGLGCAQPLTILLTYNHAPAGRSGEALGLRITVNKLTQIAVPVVFGGLGSAFGLIPVFWANGAFLLAGGFVSLAERRISARRDAAAVITEQKEEDTT